MVVIGLTGNIGTGKTTVSQILAKLGALIIDADKLGHKLLHPQTQTWHEIVFAFGRNILKPNGEIDRHKLAQIVFSNPEALTELNQIMHPRMYQIAKEKIEDGRRQGAKVIVLEAPLLIEAGWMPLVNQLWVTTAPKTVIMKRLKSQKGLDEAQILARLNSQLPQKEKIKQAHVVIDTNCDLSELEAKVTELWRKVTTNGL